MEVLDLMYKYLEKCDLDIEIYEYDPLSPDDLFEEFKIRWNSISNIEKKQIFGSRLLKQIEVIDNAINVDNIQSMVSLIEYNNIGVKTLQKCFNMVMNYNISLSLNLE